VDKPLSDCLGLGNRRLVFPDVESMRLAGGSEEKKSPGSRVAVQIASLLAADN